MAVSLELLEYLASKGFSTQELLEAARAAEAGVVVKRSSGAERQARYRANKKINEINGSNKSDVTSDVTVDVTSDVTSDVTVKADDTPPPAPPSQENPSSKKDPKGSQKGSPLPEGWRPSEAALAWSEERGITAEQIDEQVAAIEDWALANAHLSKTRKSNWDRFYYSWMRDKYPLKPKPTAAALSLDTELGIMIKEYPKLAKPMGTALDNTREAYARALATGATAAEILAGVIGYARDCRRRPKNEQDDRFIPALGRFLDEHRWKNYHAATPTAGGVPVEMWRKFVERAKETGQWPDGLGPPPSFPTPRVPRELLVEYGFVQEELPPAKSG